MMLQKANGPECPHCGCCAGETIDSSERITYERRDGVARPVEYETLLTIQCDHCRRRFRAVGKYTNGQHPGVDVVEFPVLRCPSCNGKNHFVTSTRTDGQRYHRCRTCKTNFKSQELPE